MGRQAPPGPDRQRRQHHHGHRTPSPVAAIPVDHERDLTPHSTPHLAGPTGQAPPSLLVWLWGDDLELGHAEAEALAGAPFFPLARGLIGSATADDAAGRVATTLRRMGYGRSVLRCLGWSAGATPPAGVERAIEGSFAVRAHRLDAPRAGMPGWKRIVAAAIGAELCGRLTLPRVDFAAPQTEVHAFATAEGYWWGRLLWQTDTAGFEARRANRRPFWRSIAMAPRRARCLVNLSRVPPGGALLDPFCGTGSVPIESALLGVRTYASDADPVIVEGARRNFDALGLGTQVEVQHMDARQWGERPERFDAIVCDLPYGRTASVKGGDRGDLYGTFLELAARILVPGGRAVLMLPVGALPPLPPELSVSARVVEVVHASLTREVVVLCNE